MSEVLDYDKAIIETLRHIENVLVTFSLQNYAAAGAVFLAHFTNNLDPWPTALTVVGLGVIFTAVICSNFWRFRVLWKVHRIVRDDWLAGQSGLRSALYADAECQEYLNTVTLSPLFWSLTLINLLPALAAIGAVVLGVIR